MQVIRFPLQSNNKKDTFRAIRIEQNYFASGTEADVYQCVLQSHHLFFHCLFLLLGRVAHFFRIFSFGLLPFRAHAVCLPVACRLAKPFHNGW
jgi:hypothetical protein